jgi:hypothetical protein
LSENEFPRNLICSRAAATCLRQKMMKNCSQKHLQLGKKVSKIPSTSSRKEENLKRKNNYFKRGKKNVAQIFSNKIKFSFYKSKLASGVNC